MELVQIITYVNIFLGGVDFALAIEAIYQSRRNRKILEQLKNNKEA